MAENYPDTLEAKCSHFGIVTEPFRESICKYEQRCIFKLRRNFNTEYCGLSQYFINKVPELANSISK